MKPRPLYDRIRHDIQRQIMSGVWPKGHRIPSEHELMAEYGCSRMTVNKAISALAERGLVCRRRRAGSFVTPPQIHRALLGIPEISAEIEGAGRKHRLEILDRQERLADAVECDELHMSRGAVLRIDCLHHADELPFALEERIINLSAAPDARAMDFSKISPGRWLLANVPWTDANHRITAIAADSMQSKRLGLAEGAPCLSVERWTWQAAERITYVRQLYPGNHELTARFAA